MAGFGSSFRLSGRRACLGVAEGKNNEEIVCSFASGAIEVYNVSHTLYEYTAVYVLASYSDKTVVRAHCSITHTVLINHRGLNLNSTSTNFAHNFAQMA